MNIRIITLYLCLIPNVIILSGCTEPEPSGNLASNQITAKYNIYSPYFSDPSLVISADFSHTKKGKRKTVVFPIVYTYREDDSTKTVKLSDGDVLVAGDGVESLSMHLEYSIFTTYTYYTYTSFPLPSSETMFTVTYDRANGESMVSSITIPPPPTVSSPAENQTFAVDTDDIFVNWTGKLTEEHRVSLSGPCLEGFLQTVPPAVDNFTIPAGTLLASEMSAGSCVATLVIFQSASISGTVDSRLSSDSSFVGQAPKALVHIQLSGL